MTDETATVETDGLDLATEAASAPPPRTSAYRAIGPEAPLMGGGSVFLSRSRKAEQKYVAGEAKPPVHVTAEVGISQQSIPYRAIGTALAHDVVPLVQVVRVYVKNGRLSDLVSILTGEEFGEDFACALLDGAEEFIAEHIIGEDTETETEETPADTETEDPTDLG